MHLQKLSNGIDLRVRGGEGAEQIANYAKAVAETELIPDYVEFKRQLSELGLR